MNATVLVSIGMFLSAAIIPAYAQSAASTAPADQRDQDPSVLAQNAGTTEDKSPVAALGIPNTVDSDADPPPQNITGTPAASAVLPTIAPAPDPVVSAIG